MVARPNANQYLTKTVSNEHVFWQLVAIVIVFGAFLFFIFGSRSSLKNQSNLNCQAIGTQPDITYKINLREGCDVSACDKPISIATVVSHGTQIEIDGKRSIISQNGSDWIPILYNNKKLYIARSRISC